LELRQGEKKGKGGGSYNGGEGKSRRADTSKRGAEFKRLMGRRIGIVKSAGQRRTQKFECNARRSERGGRLFRKIGEDEKRRVQFICEVTAIPSFERILNLRRK